MTMRFVLLVSFDSVFARLTKKSLSIGGNREILILKNDLESLYSDQRFQNSLRFVFL